MRKHVDLHGFGYMSRPSPTELARLFVLALRDPGSSHFGGAIRPITSTGSRFSGANPSWATHNIKNILEPAKGSVGQHRQSSPCSYLIRLSRFDAFDV